jgi:DNA-binding response OmpR family regulator
MRILIVEDEKGIADAVRKILTREHFDTDMCHDGKEGYFAATSDIYDLILLDIMLPGMDGIEILRRLRKENITTPVLMLTAKGQVEDRVLGLDSGADDYLPKPFESTELIARVKAILRRKDRSFIEEDLTYGDLLLNLKKLTLSKGAKEISLTAKEFALFQYFILRKGMITSKDQIIEKLWGYETEAADNNVEVYISFLRKKLKFLSSSVEIRTIRGMGYSLEGDS